MAYGGAMLVLSEQWYSEYEKSPFHFFNDGGEWKQIDKLGHSITSYYEGRLGYEAMRWAGVSEKKAAIWGGSLGFLLQTPIELLDAHSEGWGWSWWDVAANASGSALFVSQQLAWEEQKVLLKVSFHPSEYAQYRPETFGSNFPEQALKDYNGHTFWLSLPMGEVMPEKLPQWLCISGGYGAQGLLGAFSNPDEINGQPLPQVPRYRQYYLSLDIDWTRIPTNSKVLKSAFTLLSFWKFPAPAVEFNRFGVELHPVYF